MERISTPKTAVPLEVQKVLDSMTDENWAQDKYICNDGRMCFFGRAGTVLGIDPHELHTCYPRMPGLPAYADLMNRCIDAYADDPAAVNDMASSLSDFKSKIIALYGGAKP